MLGKECVLFRNDRRGGVDGECAYMYAQIERLGGFHRFFPSVFVPNERTFTSVFSCTNHNNMSVTLTL